MEKRFTNGEIRKLSEYIILLKDHKNDRARLKVMREYALFERDFNFFLAEAEANLQSKELKEILFDFIKDYPDEYDMESVIARIEDSGHAPLIKAFY